LNDSGVRLAPPSTRVSSENNVARYAACVSYGMKEQDAIKARYARVAGTLVERGRGAGQRAARQWPAARRAAGGDQGARGLVPWPRRGAAAGPGAGARRRPRGDQRHRCAGSARAGARWRRRFWARRGTARHPWVRRASRSTPRSGSGRRCQHGGRRGDPGPPGRWRAGCVSEPGRVRPYGGDSRAANAGWAAWACHATAAARWRRSAAGGWGGAGARPGARRRLITADGGAAPGARAPVAVGAPAAGGRDGAGQPRPPVPPGTSRGHTSAHRCAPAAASTGGKPAAPPSSATAAPRRRHHRPDGRARHRPRPGRAARPDAQLATIHPSAAHGGWNGTIAPRPTIRRGCS
jgi:hypothetical protein